MLTALYAAPDGEIFDAPGQAAGQQGTQGAVGLLEPDAQLAIVIRQAEPQIAVIEADGVIILHHHHGATGVPLMLPGNEPLALQQPLDAIITPLDPEGPLAQGAQ